MSQPILLPWRGVAPKIHPTAFIAPGAVVVGDVEIGEESSVWFGCVLRGDVNVIRIGARSNLQDGTVVHVAAKGKGTWIGDDCTIGHSALLHDCVLENHSFVGMRATVLDGARLETDSMLAAGAMLTGGKTLPTRELWAGSPASLMREMQEKDLEQITIRAAQYVELARAWKDSLETSELNQMGSPLSRG